MNSSDKLNAGGAAASGGIDFQASLGAFFLSHILTKNKLPNNFRLNNAAPISIGFETEVPTDDILLKTSSGGVLAIQAKTSLSLSDKEDSDFRSVIAQFILTYKNSENISSISRSLDAEKDRLILAVSEKTPNTISRDLKKALDTKNASPQTKLNKAESYAISKYISAVEKEWAKLFNTRFEDGFAEKLATFIVIYQLPELSSELSRELLKTSLEKHDQVDGAVALLGKYSLGLMKGRLFADVDGIRRYLIYSDIKLRQPAEYAEDIESLKRLTRDSLNSFSKFSLIELGGNKKRHIAREVTKAAISGIAKDEPILVIGEPGTGKSGVLFSMAEQLLKLGKDTIIISVDELSVETEEGLTNRMNLRNSLPKVLANWNGKEKGWVVIDALDAARNASTSRVFYDLIRELLSKTRWNVIAAIRTFDLRYGAEYSQLFKGSPLNTNFQNPDFEQIRHINVSGWTDSEFENVLSLSKTLNAIMETSSSFEDLLRVPFNTSLYFDLIKDGVVANEFANIRNQTQLLGLYWKRRVESLGYETLPCINHVIEKMIDSGELTLSTFRLDSVFAASVEKLSKNGVFSLSSSQLKLGFKHHIIFDYAVSKTLLDKDEFVSAQWTLPINKNLGLMIGPAVQYLMTEIWGSSNDRSDYWKTIAIFLHQDDLDPILKALLCRHASIMPTHNDDFDGLNVLFVDKQVEALNLTTKIGGSLAVLIERSSSNDFSPWIEFLNTNSDVIYSNVPNVGMFYLHKLSNWAKQYTKESHLTGLGKASRKFLSTALAMKEYNSIYIVNGITFVAETFVSSPEASKKLLKTFLDDSRRFEEHGYSEVPAICRSIKTIAAVDPNFAKEIFIFVYMNDIRSTDTTSMGNSAIMPLNSFKSQDYGMSRYYLEEFIEEFLAEHPMQGIEAIIKGVRGYVDRKHPIKPSMQRSEFTIAGTSSALQSDYSYIWQSTQPDKDSEDGSFLLYALSSFLLNADEGLANKAVKYIIETSDLAVIWKQLFFVAVNRQDRFSQILLPFAMNETFMLCSSTMQAAIDLLASFYSRLPVANRVAFEETLEGFDYTDFKEPLKAKTSIERRLLATIGRDNLAIVSSLERFDELFPDEPPDDLNKPLFQMETSWGEAVEDYHYVENLDKSRSVESDLIEIINLTKSKLGLNNKVEVSLSPSEILNICSELLSKINWSENHPDLISDAEYSIAQGIELLVKHVDAGSVFEENEDAVIEMIKVCAESLGPKVTENTEKNYENHASWNSPAARVSIARILTSFMKMRPGTFEKLRAVNEQLLNDEHPAVRTQSTYSQSFIIDVQSDYFWDGMSTFLKRETNAKVIDHSFGRMVDYLCNKDFRKTESLISGYLERALDFEPDAKNKAFLNIASFVGIPTIRYNSIVFDDVITLWALNFTEHKEYLIAILNSLRGSYTAGIGKVGAWEDNAKIRSRARLLLQRLYKPSRQYLSENLAEENAGFSKDKEERLKAALDIISSAGQSVFFHPNFRTNQGGLDKLVPKEYLGEIQNILLELVEQSYARTKYDILRHVENFISTSPEVTFDIISHILLNGKINSGFEQDQLSSRLSVKIMGRFIADHRVIFKDQSRQIKLLRCVDLFSDRGWPSARKLLYDLPDIFR